MDPAFEEIYEDLIDAYKDRRSWYEPYPFYRRQFYPDKIYQIIKDANQKVDHGKLLRPDASLFLLVNLDQIITLPLLHHKSPSVESINLEEIRIEEMLLQDTIIIISVAAEEAKEKNYITASNILKATSKVLTSLNAKDWRLWDENDE